MAYRTGDTAFTSAIAGTLTSGSLTSVTGDVAVIFWTTGQAHPVSSFSDSLGNTWSQPSGSPYGLGGSTGYIYCYVSALANVGAFTITINVSGGSNYIVMNRTLYSGRAASSFLDGTLGTFVDTGFVQSHVGPAITTSLAGSDVVGCMFESGSAGGSTAVDTFTAGTGFTQAVAFNGSGSVTSPLMTQYRANSAAGTYTGGCTTVNFVEASGVIIALAAATPSGGASAAGGLDGGLNGGFQ